MAGKNMEFMEALQQLARDQSIDESELLQALADALLAAYKRRMDSAEDAEVEINTCLLYTSDAADE